MGFTIIGGVPRDEIVIDLFGIPPVSHDDMTRQEEQNRLLLLPQIKKTDCTGVVPHGRPLAVIGGGISIEDHVETLQKWSGDRWSINGTYHWCKKHNIDSRFVACDPHEIVAQWAKNVSDAIVTTRCHPYVFDVLRANKAKIETFDLSGDEQIATGSSTATSIPHLAALRGYRHITFFGCEGSYTQERTHAYMKEVRSEEMIILCDGEQYYTAPDFLMQTGELSRIINIAPDGICEQSGGLLSAMIRAKGAYKILWISDGLWQGLKPKEVVSEAEAAAA
jgi:hypothetical protein